MLYKYTTSATAITHRPTPGARVAQCFPTYVKLKDIPAGLSRVFKEGAYAGALENMYRGVFSTLILSSGLRGLCGAAVPAAGTSFKATAPFGKPVAAYAGPTLSYGGPTRAPGNIVEVRCAG